MDLITFLAVIGAVTLSLLALKAIPWILVAALALIFYVFSVLAAGGRAIGRGIKRAGKSISIRLLLAVGLVQGFVGQAIRTARGK